MSKYARQLSESDVDALFTGHFEVQPVERCDNCNFAIESDDALTFGDPGAVIHSLRINLIDGVEFEETYEWAFERPVVVGSEFARELEILRARHKRQHITLCYHCADALDDTVPSRRKFDVVVNVRSATPPHDEMPRLFAVE